jgi:hypothetical protein
MYSKLAFAQSGFLKKTVFLSLVALPFLYSPHVSAQDQFKGLAPLFTTPLNYTAGYAVTPPVVDGDITDKSWANVPWTTDFADIEGDLKPKPFFKTRCKMIWDKDYLYIAAEIKDPHIWANVKNHDEVIFQDNDFEIFIDPDNNTHQYFEIEVNAINTVWDLFMNKPYRNNAGGMDSWESGLRSAVKVQGTVNDPTDKDKGWTVEFAIPYKAFTVAGKIKSPEEGETWRINFSRVQWDTQVSDGKYVKEKDATGKDLPERNWVWSPQGLINMHYPERWGYLKFSTLPAGKKQPAFELPYAEKQKNFLWLVYYRQKEYFEKQGKYALSLSALNLPATFMLEGKGNSLTLEAMSQQFYLSLRADGQATISINQDGLVKTLN